MNSSLQTPSNAVIEISNVDTGSLPEPLKLVQPRVIITGTATANGNIEYTASDIRKILQELFPHRRLVLSQFTFFNQVGVAKPTGESFRRGRRCYRLEDVLSIACVLALKEQGIPLKNIEPVPAMIQEKAEAIFALGEGCRVMGYGPAVSLQFPADGPTTSFAALDALLSGVGTSHLFWSYDVGVLAQQLRDVANGVPIQRVEELQAA